MLLYSTRRGHGYTWGPKPSWEPPHVPAHLQSNTQPFNALTPPPPAIAARLTLALLASLIPACVLAQQPLPRTVVLLDPAHGGADTGAHLGDNLLEKDLTLAFAARLRGILVTSGFTVIATRDTDPAVPFTTVQRADIANHARPTACVILHATSSGTGLHVVTSALPPDDIYDPDAPHLIVPWDSAQTASIPQSLRLANELGVALVHARVPVILSRASLPPLDNLTCPAVAIEIAPLPRKGGLTPVDDANYQQTIAQSIAAGLASWRLHNVPSGSAR